MTGTDARGWGWVAHLREGGCTPWAEFTGTAAPDAGPFPGAAQLELARRVNLAGGSTDVVRRILGTGAPARGRQEFLLRGAVAERDYGPRPVDPSEVPPAELVRVAVGALAEQLARAPRLPAPAPQRRRRCARGSGVLALPLAPVDALLYDVWASRAARGPVLPWPQWTVRSAHLERVPAALRFRRRGEEWRATGFRRRVELTAAALGPVIEPEAAEVVRKVQPLLGGLVDPTRRAELVDRVLRPWMEARTGGTALVVPEEARAWARGVAEGIAADVRRAGYPVRGDLGTLWAMAEAGRARPLGERVLEVTVQVLCDGWETR